MKSFLLLSTLAALAASAHAAVLTRGPYLQSGTPTSMVVRWRTDELTPSLVRYGTAPGVLDQTAKAAGILREHIVQLDGLQPATRYYYSIGTEEQTLAGGEDCTFVTHPVAGTVQPVHVWVLGDPGTKGDLQRAVRDGFMLATKNKTPDLWLMLGDNAYSTGTDEEFQAAVFDMYPTTLRQSVLWPTLGNHDAGSANSSTQSGVYYDIFTLPTHGQAGGQPSGTEAYYAFDFANVHFVCLDSHDTDRSADGAMAAWLKADLASTRREWIIAFFHHPTYTKGTHDSDNDTDSAGRMRDMREIFMPIMEAGGVDLILTGHSHNYERSFLLDGHYGKSDTFNLAKMARDRGDGREKGTGAYRKPAGKKPHRGEVSVVAGSSGHASSKPIPLNHPAMFISLNEMGSVAIDINGRRLDLTFINEQGVTRDQFTMIKE